MNPKVSVIIPVYNVEKYLKRCVDSVINQTLKELEIILVDDGSPDNSPQICDEYKSKDDRIRVIHKQNGGLASARNAGMKIATGEYIFFVDSDDWIDSNTLEELTDIVQRYNVDWVRFRPMCNGWPNKQENSLCDFGTEKILHEGVYERKQIVNDLFPTLFATPDLNLGVIVAAWRSLYRTDFLRNNKLIFEDSVRYSEDTIFSARVVKATNRFYYLDGPHYYHYFYNSLSISKSFRKDRWSSYKNLIASFEHYFQNNNEYDFSNQLWLQKLYCIESALGQRRFIDNISDRIAYCDLICNDPITISAMKHLDLLSVGWKHKCFLLLIKWKMVHLLSRL